MSLTIATEPRAPGRAGTLRSLRVPNYRRYTAANLASTTGTWMQMVAQNWLVMKATGSTTALGASVMLQALPGVALGLWGGVLADRVARRRLLCVFQVLHAGLAIGMGLLAATGHLTVGTLFAAAALTGVLAALEGPAGAAFNSELVPADVLPNAIALGSAVSSTGRLVGMALAGVVVPILGPATAFLANGASYLGVLAVLATLRTDQLQPARREGRARGQLREGFRHVAGSHRLLVTMALAFVLATFGRNFQVTMAAMTEGPLGSGAEGYSMASTVFAAGTLVGAFVAARLPRLSARILVLAGTVAAAFQVLSGVAPGMPAFLTALLPAAMAAVVIDSALSSILQLESPARLRGRVLSLLSIASMSGAALGGPLLGRLAETFGARSSLVIGGALAAAGALAGGLAYRRPWPLRRRVPAPEPVTLLEVGVATAPARAA